MADDDRRKRVWKRIDRDDPKVTLRDVHQLLEQIQRDHPAEDIFFDGDEFAICSWSVETKVPPPRGKRPAKLKQGRLM